MNEPKPPPPKRPNLFSDSHLPQADESNSDTVWEQFRALEATHNARFADTQPADKSLLMDALARKPAPRAGGMSIDDVLVEARRNNRVCPQPVFWFQLYDLLPESPRRPVPPPDGPAWRAASSLAKRMALRDHLEYANAAGVLPAVMSFMRGLREENWLHMADE